MQTVKKIWVNCLVKNEERWIWYALNSVLAYVDKILVWDTGSTDSTMAIVKSIKNTKIDFQEIGEVSLADFGKVRQKMLEATKSDWVFILDGDEVWPEKSIRSLVEEAGQVGPAIQGLCVRPINFVGDIRFIHPETFKGQASHAPKGIQGFFSTRIFRRDILGLHASNPYGKESFFDDDNKTIREQQNRVKYLEKVYYWHMSYLPRSLSDLKDKEVMMRTKKRKYEIGIPRPKWIQIPEVFYQPRPSIVLNPFFKMNKLDYLRAVIQTPFKKLKRRFFQ